MLRLRSTASVVLAMLATLGPVDAQPPASGEVPRWSRVERVFTSATSHADPFHDVDLRVTFTAPSGRTTTVDGFWDGDATWRVRFAPDEIGTWSWVTTSSPATDSGLHGQRGQFRVVAPAGTTRFAQHGPVRVVKGRTFLEHADGTPFFWLADTGWNAALLSTPDEWTTYLRTRVRQRFTAVQWVATQWRAAPSGDRLGERAYTGQDRIRINPAFFRRLDDKATALEREGLLNVPVLLWAIGSGSDATVNPGYSLPEPEAIRLARYMVARWQAHPVAWILPGDGDYRGEKAERWRRIGRAVFDDDTAAPVLLHPGGMQWVLDEFSAESWVDIHGYQSGHGDDDKTLRWMTEGPPARDWTRQPTRPFINLEPPYEYHVAYQSRGRITPHTVRRAIYWSLLNAPVAGVTYGGHGIWGWDDGTRTPTDHPGSGVPLPWRQAVTMPGAEQMAHLAALFTSIDFTALRPAPEALVEQPGAARPAACIAVATAPSAGVLVAYTPERAAIALRRTAVPTGRAVWVNPRTGEREAAQATTEGDVVRFAPTGDEDWILMIGGNR